MDWSIKKFDNLKLTELYDLLKLRSSVFVVEQECAYQDLDDNDRHATHLMGYQKSKMVAYSRIFPPGVFEKHFSRIGRIVTKKQNRGNGIGSSLVQKSIEYCREQFGHRVIKISAQVYLKNFYERLGFVEKGKIYLEDGIPHCSMYIEFRQ